MRARLVPVLLAMTAVASGCAGGGEAEVTAAPLPPAPASPSPTAAATPLAAEVPAEANEATPEGAAEFVRLFYSTVVASYRSRDPEPIQRLSLEACEACDGFQQTVESLVEDNSRVQEHYAVEVISVDAPGIEPGQATVTAVAIINVTEFVLLNAEGEVTLREPALHNAAQNVSLTRSGGSWRVAEVSS